MKKIMEVHGIYELPNAGVVIGGSEPELDVMSREQIVHLISNKIEIHNQDGSHLEVEVITTDVATSLIGKKNVDILLEGSVSKEIIGIGALVYKSDQE